MHWVDMWERDEPPYPKAKSGEKHVLVITDHFTKWVEPIPTRDQTSITVVRYFYERIICRFGRPRRLLSDNGPHFKADQFEALCRQFGIKKIFAFAYCPQEDGAAERMMRTMNNSLSVLHVSLSLEGFQDYHLTSLAQ